jgi:hypothetical protein
MAPTTPSRSALPRRLARLSVFALAVLGALAGIGVLYLQIEGGALDDVRAYYDAGARLNAGLPLYPPGGDPDAADYYRYPPLLAIAFRPLALLPFEAAAAIWEAVVIASLAGTAWWIGFRRRETWLALGILAVPIAWAVAIGQAQVPLTLLTALGSPWSIALATHLKLFPALIALWWIGRRDWRAVGAFLAWTGGLAALQLVLAPQATIDFLATLTLEQVGEVRNVSPYAISPLLWVILVGAGSLLVVRLAPTRWGWAAAVAFSVLATPRLLVYMLMTLLAGLRAPKPAPGPPGPSAWPVTRSGDEDARIERR